MRDIPDNHDDYIDGDDIESRIEELEGEREAIIEEIDEMQEAIDDPDEEVSPTAAADVAAKRAELVAWDAENGAELAMFKALAKEIEDYSNESLRYARLIRESAWIDHVKELLEDIGDLPRDLPSYIAIDWDKTAENIRVDYTEVDFDGVTYLVR